MMKFIEKPNLPTGKVTSLICGKLPQEIMNFFEQRGIRAFFSEENSFIDCSVKNHADMAAVHLGENRIVLDRAQKNLSGELTEYGMKVTMTESEIKGEYPHDIKLNVALIGNYAVGAFSHSDPNLLSNLQSCKKLEVKQGYARCSLLPVNEKAVITDDISIFKALKNTFDVLLISKGDISLTGHEYGFIGGASAKISQSEILFFGDVTKHKDYKDIQAFLTKHNCTETHFESFQLADFGGVVTLTENV